MMNILARSWRLRSVLVGLVAATILLTFTLVDGTILLVQIPNLKREARADVAREAAEVTARVETTLGSLESRLEFLGKTLQTGATMQQSNAMLDRALGAGPAIRAIYLVSLKGKVLAAGLAAEQRGLRADLLGSDVSATRLFREVVQRRRLVWGDKYLSALSGAVTVGVAMPVDSDLVLMAEIPISYLLSTVQLAIGGKNSSVWLVDRAGEVLVDTMGGRFVNTVNMLNLPVVQAAVAGRELPREFEMAGRSYYPGVSRSGKLDWYVVAGIPAGLENSRIRATVIYVAGGFVGSLLVGLVLAPLWSARLTQALTRIVGRADQITRGEVAGQWPRSLITEFNQISTDLEKMATGLQEREQKLQAVFNTAPVAMSLTDMDNHSVLIDVNEAWCRTFARRREEALGRSGVELGLWRSLEERDAAVQRSAATGGMVETWAVRGDGVPILCQAFRRELRQGDANLMIWASVDITAVRRTEDALRDLNADLEARVASRTRQLEKLNTELSGAFENLRMTQGELVRSEKMAALGSLVAGVSHELNTPLGNGLMAVSALADAVRSFKGTMQSGLRRSDLEDFVLRVDQGADIAVRNLQRAADLVVSFKQVAVDQTSSQRRRFELSEVVHEMVISLGPTLRRTPYEVVLDVPKIGLLLDSYPGPLGQTLGNLINNAVMHAFDGRQNGTIRITGYRDVNGWIALRVEDNGQGIPAALLPRIFDPFVTTKMGRGGTGLGLHIAYNAVTTLLGGTLTVHSVQGQGTTFELHLPEQAPLAV